MLLGFSDLVKFSASSSPEISQLQTYLQENSAVLGSYPSVDGSLKRVYALPGGRLALACFRETGTEKLLLNGKALLKREKALLAYLQDLGLPTVSIHGEPFAINDQYALLMAWIDDANFIDVKDQESAARKLIAAILGMHIPAGEGWVLQKNALESKISETIVGADFSLEKFTQRAAKILVEFNHIMKTLEQTDHLINDLQLLVNQQGVYIIDPMDVVKKNPRANNPNMCDYHSVLDDSKQEHPDFIKVLYDGKRMLQQCVNYCESLANVESKEACAKLVLNLLTPREMISPRGSSLHQSLLQKQMGARPMVLSSFAVSSRKSSSSSSQTKKRPSPSAFAVGLPAQHESIAMPYPSTRKSPKNSPASSPQTSPTKENGSPTKELCSQFRITSLKVKKCLFLEKKTEISEEVAVDLSPPSKAALKLSQ